MPEGARYSPVDDEGGPVVASPTAPGLPPGTVLRAVFSNGAGRRWVVLLDTSRDSQGVRLPMPPAPLEDRTFLGNHLGSFASLELQTWSLREGGLPDGGPLPLEALTRDENLSRLGELVVASVGPDGDPLKLASRVCLGYRSGQSWVRTRPSSRSSRRFPSGRSISTRPWW
ncbi:hypothetical protein ACN28S_18225 [Cystobacter fuscus]